MPRHSFSAVLIADHRNLNTDGAALADRGSAEVPAGGLQQVSAGFAALFEEVVLVAADPGSLLDHDGLIVGDHRSSAGILSGIQAGLFAAAHTHVLVTSSSLPALRPALIDLLVGAVAPRYDAVLPAGEPGLQPLPAVYAKSCLKTLARQLSHDRPSVHRWLRQLRLRTVAEDALRKCDPQWVPNFRIAAVDAPE